MKRAHGWGADPLLAEYRYDARHRRIVKLVPNGSNWDRTDYYYTNAWQIIEERSDTVTAANKDVPVTDVKYQYVWDVRYIDAPICRDEDVNDNDVCTDADPTDEHLFYTQDANFNVTALIDGSDGSVVRRYEYDPYGQPTFLTAAFASSTNVEENEILYAGYRYDPETALHQVRHRYYHADLGRFVTRDPDGYVDGMNLYQYCGSGPVSATDPMGTDYIRVERGQVWWIIQEDGYLWNTDKRWYWLGRVEGDSVRAEADFSMCHDLSTTGKLIPLEPLKEYADLFWREHIDISGRPSYQQDLVIGWALSRVAAGQRIKSKSEAAIYADSAYSGFSYANAELNYAVRSWFGSGKDVAYWRKEADYWAWKSGFTAPGDTTRQITRASMGVGAAGGLCAAALKALAALGVSQIGTVPLSQVLSQAQEELRALGQGIGDSLRSGWHAVSGRATIAGTNDSIAHVLARHFPGGAQTANASIFNAGERIPALLRAAEAVRPVAQRVGPNFQRIVDAGRTIGVDRATGQATRIYTVITNAMGELVTMFPGLPAR